MIQILRIFPVGYNGREDKEWDEARIEDGGKDAVGGLGDWRSVEWRSRFVVDTVNSMQNCNSGLYAEENNTIRALLFL